VGAKQTATSERAGVARLSESTICNRDFRSIVMALLPEEELPPLAEALEAMTDLTLRQRRMLRLAAPALKEAVADIGPPADTPLLLAFPEALPGRPAPAGGKFLEHLAKQSGVTFRIAGSCVFPNGRAAGFLALAQALALLDTGKESRVIVGGVDSHLDLHLIGTLDAESRLLADGVMDGFIPGEGASFLLLGAAAGERGGPPRSRILAVATGTERGHRYSEEPYLGEGLAATFQELFSTAGVKEPVQTVLAGLNGEHFGAKEWGTALMRSKKAFADAMRLEHPVDCFGDPGAALGPLLLGIAAIGVREGHLGEPCLVWSSSDRGERGAALLQRAAS
jgi:3-oxoacyl-[acyl-carrier-protein] synthase-1